MLRFLPQNWLFALVYLLLLCTYYTSAHVFTQYCTPLGFWGFLQTPFLIETVQCRALNWIFTYSHAYIQSLWILMSTYTIQLIVKFVGHVNNRVDGTTPGMLS